MLVILDNIYLSMTYLGDKIYLGRPKYIQDCVFLQSQATANPLLIIFGVKPINIVASMITPTTGISHTDS